MGEVDRGTNTCLPLTSLDLRFRIFWSRKRAYNRRMLLSVRFLLLSIAVPGFGADWNPRLAATYLDAREESWRAWPYANQFGVPCISCHTGLPCLLARPLLRGALRDGVRTS